MRELKQYERNQNRENVVRDNNLGRFFESATAKKIYINGLNIHHFNDGSLLD